MKRTILRIVALALVAVMSCAMLVSCGGPASDPDKALEALKDNDYAAAKDSTVTPAILKAIGVDGVDCVVSGTNKDGETVTIVYFDEKDDVNDAWEDVEKIMEKITDKEDREDSDWVCKKSGKMIYFGTKTAVKAAK